MLLILIFYQQLARLLLTQKKSWLLSSQTLLSLGIFSNGSKGMQFIVKRPFNFFFKKIFFPEMLFSSQWHCNSNVELSPTLNAFWAKFYFMYLRPYFSTNPTFENSLKNPHFLFSRMGVFELWIFSKNPLKPAFT